METKKISFFKQMYKSITDFDYYKQLVHNKTSKCFAYFFILVLIYAIIGTIAISYSTSKNMNQIKRFIDSEINELNYNNGILNVNADIYKSYYNDEIIIDTSGNEITETKGAKAIFQKDQFSILVQNQYISFPYKIFLSGNYNKESIINLFEFKNYAVMIVFISMIATYISFGISTILDILVVALIGYILFRVVGNTKIGYKKSLNISIHAVTLPVILAMTYLLINTFTGFEVKYFSTMYTSISTIYVTTAVILIKMEEKNNIERR